MEPSVAEPPEAMKPDEVRACRSEKIVSGNVYDKYGSKNPAVRLLMRGFFAAAEDLLRPLSPVKILEVGCGEGEVGARLAAIYPEATYCGVDVDPGIIAEAQARFPRLRFEVLSLYDIDQKVEAPDLVVALEVFEHLDDPAKGMRSLLSISWSHLLISVPREPLWRVLNLARVKYLSSWGNTPGHLNHWSRSGFLRFLERFGTLRVREVRSPLPWTMVLCERLHADTPA